MSDRKFEQRSRRSKERTVILRRGGLIADKWVRQSTTEAGEVSSLAAMANVPIRQFARLPTLSAGLVARARLALQTSMLTERVHVHHELRMLA